MTLFVSQRLWAVLAIIVSVSAALGQPEQWLHYRTVQEPQAYRWIDLTNTPPTGVVWPKLGSGAQYGRWQTPADPKGGLWLCLDRVGKNGPCDRLFIDSNGNGRLDDETPLKANRREESMSFFDPARITFKGEDGPIIYHLICRFYQFGTERAQLLTGSGGVYEGNVTFGGKKRALQLVDSTVNAVFNDTSDNPFEADRVVLDSKDGRYLGRLLELDNQLFGIEVASDGAFVKVQSGVKVKLGQVRVPETIAEFSVVGTNGQFTRKPLKGETTIPAGTYRVHAWSVERKDSGSATWTLNGSSFTEFARFEAPASEPVQLRLGEPISALLQATQAKSELSFNLRLQGQLGETVQILKGKELAPAPRLQIMSADGTLRSLTSFQYG